MSNEREKQYPVPSSELYYYDKITGKHTPVASDSGMLGTRSVQKKWRDSFSIGNALDTTEKWDLLQQGAGQTIAQANGILDITTGTTINSETILQTKEIFSDPFRVLTAIKLSQKIANQAVFIEAVSVNPTTGIPDGLHTVAWRISGDDNTTNDFAVYETQSGGQPRLASTAVDTNVVHVGSFGILELELFSDEVWYHARGMDSTNGRSYSAVRHQQIPDPNAYFKIRIRVLNKGVAPASNTTVSFQYVTVIDYAELTAEITAGRGQTSAGQGIAVNGNVGVSGTVGVSAMPTPANGYPTTSTSTILANNAYASPSIDFGSTSIGQQRIRIMVMHTAGNTHGHLVVEHSTDGTTWREGHREPVASDGLYKTFEFPVLMRYARVRFLNGTVNQTAFFISYTLVKTDGEFMLDRHQIFQEIAGTMTASQALTSTSLDVGGNGKLKKRLVTIFADQAGTYFIEGSRDNSAWRTIQTGTVTANTLFKYSEDITYRYMRVRYTNTATASTITEIFTILSEG